MAFALQPTLTRWPVWCGQLLVLTILLIGLAGLNAADHQRHKAPRLLLSGPDVTAEQHFVTVAKQQIDAAKHRVWLMVYVLRPGRNDNGPVHALVSSLQQAQRRGCDVRVVLDQSRAYQSDELDPKHETAATFLQEYNIPVVIDELRTRSHAKMLLIDDNQTIIGSHNWTYSALTYNRESSVLTHDFAIAQQIASVFQGVAGWE